MTVMVDSYLVQEVSTGDRPVTSIMGQLVVRLLSLHLFRVSQLPSICLHPSLPYNRSLSPPRSSLPRHTPNFLAEGMRIVEMS
jgi:hypothetical protein